MLRRRTQYRIADDPARAVPIVRGIVAAKPANQRTVVMRAARDHGASMPTQAAIALATAEQRLDNIARRTLATHDVDGLRGLEGEAAAVYFGVFDSLIRREGPEFRFATRLRRPPLDRINALLSFLYGRGSKLVGVGSRPARDGRPLTGARVETACDTETSRLVWVRPRLPSQAPP